MKVFLGFMFLSIFIGTLWERKAPKQYVVIALSLSTLVAIGYYYFNQL